MTNLEAAGMPITVKKAELADAHQANALYEILNSYASGPGGQNAPIPPDARDRLAPGLLDSPSGFVLLAYLDGNPVGTAVCFQGFSTFVGKPNINIHDLAVLPDFRSRGIGSALLDGVEQHARRIGACKITLEVHDTNDGAKRLYRSAGFGPWDARTLFLSKEL